MIPPTEKKRFLENRYKVLSIKSLQAKWLDSMMIKFFQNVK